MLITRNKRESALAAYGCTRGKHSNLTLLSQIILNNLICAIIVKHFSALQTTAIERRVFLSFMHFRSEFPFEKWTTHRRPCTIQFLKRLFCTISQTFTVVTAFNFCTAAVCHRKRSNNQLFHHPLSDDDREFTDVASTAFMVFAASQPRSVGYSIMSPKIYYEIKNQV